MEASHVRVDHPKVVRLLVLVGLEKLDFEVLALTDLVAQLRHFLVCHHTETDVKPSSFGFLDEQNSHKA